MGRSMGSHEYVAMLKGQTLRFPNLAEPVKSWPRGMSLTLKFSPKFNISTYCSFLGPAKHSKYLYLWDDDTDNPELTNLVSDLEASVAFREKSIAHFKRFLSGGPLQGQSNAHFLPIILRNFDAVGEGAAFRMTT
ncbi:hypothetical protein E8E14_010197 [Neopestalotiopsis sp. 37M]|nr:hypothetical protein E8E14_010197 [Neopestalotiopsis sp. 37M]